jgi:hypothetical protein
MKVQVREAMDMLQAITKLDGPEGTPYKYDAATRIALARTKRELRAVSEDFVEARNKLIEEINPGGIPPLNGSESSMAMHVAFNKRELELIKVEVELNAEPLDVEKLKLDENAIPAGVLEGLGSFLKL